MRPLKILAALLLLAAPAFAQRSETHLAEPVYQGERASAPIPSSLHVRNEGGSDGAGLCVISSVLANGMYQGVPGLDVAGPDGKAGKGSQLWKTAKSRPGGYWPERLNALVNELMPNELKASYSGNDPSVLDRLSRDGYPIGATMGTGERYGWGPISHMISLLHFRSSGSACVVDNNFPGEFTWMSADEFVRRWTMGGEGWAWIWTRKPGLDGSDSGEMIVILAAGVAAWMIVAYERGYFR